MAAQAGITLDEDTMTVTFHEVHSLYTADPA